MKFTDLSLPPELIAALAKQQISDPSPIQIAAIPPLAAGKDTYLRAETGTGKTLAYLLPLLPLPSHTKAQSWHNQSGLVTNLAQHSFELRSLTRGGK
jgi:ATP-dependent RNA helicase RhlE